MKLKKSSLSKSKVKTKTVGFAVVVLLVLAMFTFLNYPSIREASAFTGTLISNLQTLVQNTVNWTENGLTALIGYNLGSLTLTQLESVADNQTNWMNVLYMYAEMMKYGVENQSKIEWALNNATMLSNGLPLTYNWSTWNGYTQVNHYTFLINTRYTLYGYYWAQKYNYELDKWNMTNAFNHYNHATNLTGYQGWSLMYSDDSPWGATLGPRYYDEAAQVLDGYLIFYQIGVNQALSYASTMWDYINNNIWNRTYGYYQYSPASTDYECEAGGFYQVALKLKHLDPPIGDISRVTTDTVTRFLASKWSSPQWSQGVVVHANPSNPELRLQNTLTAWNSIIGNFYNLNSAQRDNVTDLLLGYDSYDPAWKRLYESPLWGGDYSGLPMFRSSTHDSFTASGCNSPTAEACQLLLLYGIVPSTGAVAMPLADMCYEDVMSSVDKQTCSLDISSRDLTLAIGQPGMINFTYGTTMCSYTFNQVGVYNITFASDWNSIQSVTRLGDLPTNRIYFTSGDTLAPTYDNIGYSTTVAGQPCRFSCLWQDNMALSGSIFSTNNTGPWTNDTWTAISQNPGWTNTTKTLNNTADLVIGFQWFCNDTSNNWGTTGIQTLTTTIPPSLKVALNSPSNGAVGTSLTVTFAFMPVIVGDVLQDASLWTNDSRSWASTASNASELVNNTLNYISYTFPMTPATYVWNIQVFSTAADIFAPANYTLTITGSLSVSLVSPSNSSSTSNPTQTFTYTPIAINYPILNSSLYIYNSTDQWVEWNSSTVQNNTQNSFTCTFPAMGTYQWKVRVDTFGGYVYSVDYTITLPGPLYLYCTLALSSSDGGTITPAPGTYSYTRGSNITLTASANPGYTFVQWIIDGTGYTSPTQTITMDTNHTVAAVFQTINSTSYVATATALFAIATVISIAILVYHRRKAKP